MIQFRITCRRGLWEWANTHSWDQSVSDFEDTFESALASQQSYGQLCARLASRQSAACGGDSIIMINALRITLARVGLRLIYGASLIFFSIRDFLFGNGLYIFRDWTWPLSTSLPPIATFSPEIVRNVGPDPIGFVRMFVNWPIVVIY